MRFLRSQPYLLTSCSQVWSEQGGSELVCPLFCRECEQLIGAGERKAVGACSSKSRRVSGLLPKAEKEGVLRNRVTMWGIRNGTGNVESLICQKSVASISLDILQYWLLHSSKLWKGWHELEEVVEQGKQSRSKYSTWNKTLHGVIRGAKSLPDGRIKNMHCHIW